MRHCEWHMEDDTCYEPVAWCVKCKMVAPDGTVLDSNPTLVCGVHRVSFIENIEFLRECLERAGYQVGLEYEYGLS